MEPDLHFLILGRAQETNHAQFEQSKQDPIGKNGKKKIVQWIELQDKV